MVLLTWSKSRGKWVSVAEVEGLILVLLFIIFFDFGFVIYFQTGGFDLMCSKAEVSGELGWVRKSGNKIWRERERIHKYIVKV